MFGFDLDTIQERFQEMGKQIALLTQTKVSQEKGISVSVSFNKVIAIELSNQTNAQDILDVINEAFKELYDTAENFRQEKTEDILKDVPRIFREQIKQSLLIG